MTDLILIRHGQTDLNREPRFQGQIDVPLNALGHAQARRLGARLADERVDLIYCSDLSRTRQTAAPVSQQLAIDATPMPSLREQAFGLFEGMAFDEITQRHPELFAQWQRHDPDFALPGGESVRQFHRRVVAAVLEIAAMHEGLTLAVVTHGGVLDMLWRTANALPLQGPRECPIPNAGLNRVRVRDDSIEILGWADDAHVADLPG